MAWKDTVEVKITSGGGGVAVSGDDPDLDVYRFNGADLDFLEFGTPFTGNFKIILAGTSDTGVHADILDGLLDTWVDSRISAPHWNYSEVAVTEMTGPVSASFNGIILKYAKDDVWYSPSSNGRII